MNNLLDKDIYGYLCPRIHSVSLTIERVQQDAVASSIFNILCIAFVPLKFPIDLSS